MKIDNVKYEKDKGLNIFISYFYIGSSKKLIVQIFFRSNHF